MISTQVSLKNKILLPFFILMMLLTLLLSLGLIYIISTLSIKDHEGLLKKDLHALNNFIEQRREDQESLSTYLPSLRWHSLQRLKKKQQNKAIQIYTQLDELPFFIQERVERLLKSMTNSKSFAVEFVTKQSFEELVLISLQVFKVNQETFYYITTQQINDDVIEKWAQSRIVALYKVEKNSAEPLVMTATLYSDPLLQEKISMLIRENEIKAGKLYQVSVHDKEFSIVFRPSTIDSRLLTMVMEEKKTIIKESTTLISSVVILLIACCFLIYFIYALIISKIITSIDVLSDVALRVSKGDLEQKIYLTSKDEIGRLSTIFNSMIKNLKQSSTALIQEKIQSELILKNIPVGIIVTTANYELNLANQEAERLFNFENKNSASQLFLEFLSQQSLFNNKTSKLQTFSYEDKVGAKNRLFEICAQVIYQEKNAKAVLVIRDLTHQKEVERLRDAFLRTVTHELRTPLTSVIGYIELVQQGRDRHEGEKVQQYLKTALKEAQTLQQLIDDLLDLSQLNAGKSKMIYSNIMVKNFLNDIVISLTPLLKNKELILLNEFQDEDLEIRADRNKLRRILMNLCSNAIKFTSKGSVTISCEEKEDAFEFRVKDTGIGLKKIHQEVIFEHFRQVDDSATRQYQGTGLGLAIVRELVELHGGKISVESQYNEGSTFIFSIKKK